MDWLDALAVCRSDNTACVVVMIAHVSGSAPRSVGTRMVVTAKQIHATIGGGALEMEAISHARALLKCGADHERLSTREFNLGPDLSQCCGGKVSLQFDMHLANDFVLHVFGAGHVGQEVVRLSCRLPCLCVVHDVREDWLMQVNDIIAAQQMSESTVRTSRIHTSIYEHIEALNGPACYLVMTHSHEQDMDVVEAVLSRSDTLYCGLIASDSKAARFRNRLLRKGFSTAEITRLTAPIGKGVKTGNTPMEVAIAGISDVLTARCEVLDVKKRRPRSISPTR